MTQRHRISTRYRCAGPHSISPQTPKLSGQPRAHGHDRLAGPQPLAPFPFGWRRFVQTAPRRSSDFSGRHVNIRRRRGRRACTKDSVSHLLLVMQALEVVLARQLASADAFAGQGEGTHLAASYNDRARRCMRAFLLDWVACLRHALAEVHEEVVAAANSTCEPVTCRDIVV